MDLKGRWWKGFSTRSKFPYIRWCWVWQGTLALEDRVLLCPFLRICCSTSSVRWNGITVHSRERRQSQRTGSGLHLKLQLHEQTKALQQSARWLKHMKQEPLLDQSSFCLCSSSHSSHHSCSHTRIWDTVLIKRMRYSDTIIWWSCSKLMLYTAAPNMHKPKNFDKANTKPQHPNQASSVTWELLSVEFVYRTKTTSYSILLHLHNSLFNICW